MIYFYWKVGESQFLLDGELSKQVEQILDKNTELEHAEHMAQSTGSEPAEQVRYWKRHKEARDWLIAQEPTLLERFKPFLSHWSA